MTAAGGGPARTLRFVRDLYPGGPAASPAMPG
jgi:hypothetical protein